MLPCVARSHQRYYAEVVAAFATEDLADLESQFDNVSLALIALQEDPVRAGVCKSDAISLGSATSAHTDSTQVRTHILSALVPHLRTHLLTQARTHPIAGTQVRTQALSRMLLRIPNFTPALLT